MTCLIIKFFCFDGEPYCLYTMIDNTRNQKMEELTSLIPISTFCHITGRTLNRLKINCLNQRILIVWLSIYVHLAKAFPHVRVDFYNISG